MASSAKKIKTTPENETHLKLLYGEDALSKYWNSSLFNTVYLRHDVTEKHSCWRNDDDLDFLNFMSRIRDLCIEYKDRENVLGSMSERNLQNDFIKEVLRALNWENEVTRTSKPYMEDESFTLKGKIYKPDILILDHPNEKTVIEKKSGDDKLQEARRMILMPVEVKYWNRLEEYRQGKGEENTKSDSEADDVTRTATPNEQTVQYMSLLKKNWGMLTDGARWRLFNVDLSVEDSERYYEFNFLNLYHAICTEESGDDSAEVIEAGKYFYHFFSKFSFYPKDGNEPFVDEVLNYSRKYVNKVEEDLKERFVKAINIACNSIYRSSKENGLNSSLSTVRNVAESSLFNILFIKSLESRSILPMASTDYKKVSISSIIDKIERYDPEKDEMLNARELDRSFRKGNGNSFSYMPNGFELHERIVKLTDVINKGATSKDSFGFEISGFKESCFSTDEWKLFKSCKISNSDWVAILFELGYAESESANRKYQQIPYSYFTPRQLGSLYESFLDYVLEEAEKAYVYQNKQWIESDLSASEFRMTTLPKVKKGELFFTPNNKEKKASGSYYTHDYIVVNLLAELFDEDMKNEINFSNLKICDPAMGSGHFLTSILRYLSAERLKSLDKKSDKNLEMDMRRSKISVLESSIYGVDVNPSAVKLAKLSLWLETATIGVALTDLSKQIRCGNSLEQSFSDIFPKVNKFDYIIGNPPWGGNTFEVDDLSDDIKDTVSEKNINSFELFVRKTFSWCSTNGKLGFILPRNLIRKKQYSDLRRSILPNLSFIGDLGKFPGVLQETCSIILDTKVSDQFVFDDTLKQELAGSNKESATRLLVEKNKIKEPDYVFQAGKSDELDEIVSILGKCHKFSDLFTFGRGIEVGKAGELSECPKCKVLTNPPKKKNRKGTFEKDCECGQKITLNTKRIKIISEKNATGYKAIIAGPDIEPFKFNVSRYIKLNVDEINYKDNLHKSKVRIYIPMNNDKIVAALDQTGACLALKTAYVAAPKNVEINVNSVVEALNSDVVNFYFEYCINNGATLTNSISTENLGSLPIPKFGSNKAKSLREAYGLTARHMELISKFMEKRRGIPVKKQSSKKAA